MKSRQALQFLLAGVCVTFIYGATSAEQDNLVNDCFGFGGEVADEQCIVITVEVTPYSESVRLADRSGLACTLVGEIKTTNIETYTIAQAVEEAQALVKGNMSLPGCSTSRNMPKKCADHYETLEVVSYF